MTRPGTAITGIKLLPYKLRENPSGGTRRSQITGVPVPYAKENTARLVLPENIKATGWQLPSQLAAQYHPLDATKIPTGDRRS